MKAEHSLYAPNGVYLPKWAWGLVVGVLSTFGLGAVGWLSYVSTSQASTREEVAEMRAELRGLYQRLDRIEARLDKLLEEIKRR